MQIDEESSRREPLLVLQGIEIYWIVGGADDIVTACGLIVEDVTWPPSRR
jgi:hypothetical protein